MVLEVSLFAELHRVGSHWWKSFEVLESVGMHALDISLELKGKNSNACQCFNGK